MRREIRRARVDVVLASLADYATNRRLNQLIGSLFDAWVLVANRYGEEPPIMWHGLITITDPWARLHASSMSKEQVLVRQLSFYSPGGAGRWMRRTFVGFKLVGLAAALLPQMAWAALRKRRTR